MFENYTKEMETAEKFIKKYEMAKWFVDSLKNKNLMHSDRWSLSFDFVEDNFEDSIPKETRSLIITGIPYYVEKQMLDALE